MTIKNNKNLIIEKICTRSIKAALSQSGFAKDVEKLRKIVPDISKQESREGDVFNEYWELKRRVQQAFQVSLILKYLETQKTGKLTVVDIGDSAGTHMLYLKELTKGKFDIDTISVNLDPRAIKKIKSRGLNAILCRAEDLELGNNEIDLFTSFEMVEHLHNPSIFFHRLAKKSKCNKMVVTVPYLKRSRVGLNYIRKKLREVVYAEDVHIFELNPEDWTLLFLHSGWKVIYSKIYYQYPTKWPFISKVLSWLWRRIDYEGFWGVILEKDTSVSDIYQDWEE